MSTSPERVAGRQGSRSSPSTPWPCLHSLAVNYSIIQTLPPGCSCFKEFFIIYPPVESLENDLTFTDDILNLIHCLSDMLVYQPGCVQGIPGEKDLEKPLKTLKSLEKP